MVRHWLRTHGLQTERAKSLARPPTDRRLKRRCQRHGVTVFARVGDRPHYRCVACRSERVAARRRRVKAILVEEAGGACRLCGYDRHPAALAFHHRDPETKAFGLARRGVTRSVAEARREAGKCVLLCSNCHAEVEAGVVTAPLPDTIRGGR